MLASAASLSFGRYTIPVYEIYKVGEDLHWKDGLDFFGRFGLSLVVVPHWNNTDGGNDLDTSRCYMGRKRFDALRSMLPEEHTILGLDEHTSIVINPGAGTAEAVGAGRVTVLRGSERHVFPAGSTFPLTVLGPWTLPDTSAIAPNALARARECTHGTPGGGSAACGYPLAGGRAARGAQRQGLEQGRPAAGGNCRPRLGRCRHPRRRRTDPACPIAARRAPATFSTPVCVFTCANGRAQECPFCSSMGSHPTAARGPLLPPSWRQQDTPWWLSISAVMA